MPTVVKPVLANTVCRRLGRILEPGQAWVVLHQVEATLPGKMTELQLVCGILVWAVHMIHVQNLTGNIIAAMATSIDLL